MIADLDTKNRQRISECECTACRRKLESCSKCQVVGSHVHNAPHALPFYREPEGSDLDLLTPREMGVLKLIAQGNTVKHCAELLALAPSTVDNHKSRLMKKLGVHKSLDLTRLAIREGLVSL